MKVILYIDITANGFMGKLDGSSNFTSKEDGISFNAICQKVGTIISGRKTYEVLYPDYMPLETSGTHWVMTHDTTRTSENPTVKFTNLSPDVLLKQIEDS